METVEIEAIEARFCWGWPRIIARAQPLDELHDLGIAPHPGWKAPEAGKRFIGVNIVAYAPHITVYAISVRPVSLDRYCSEIFLCNEPLGDLGALTVELVGAMRSLA